VVLDSNNNLEQMNIVIIGHVDHGKSTVIGRLLADTGSLPEGKLDKVKEMCRRTSKPFEYAFLLDALADEQSQGITIDAARCFFKTAKRRYIIIDAPGHIEFLKNMITGASHAEAALLVIDAHEGVKENTRRHGYMASFLGIKQVVVLVNKMDLVGYDRDTFTRIRNEFEDFLGKTGMRPIAFIPISAFCGDNIVSGSDFMDWYDGPTVVQMIDELTNDANPGSKPFRMPVQDVYKFTEENDERRIFAGTIASGTVKCGDEVQFLPSGKRSHIAARAKKMPGRVMQPDSSSKRRCTSSPGR
jgi:bifunctional enzyme CysN/CysC